MKKESISAVDYISKLIAKHFDAKGPRYSDVIDGATVRVAWGAGDAPMKVPNPYLGSWVLTSVVQTDVELDNFELTYQLYKPDTYCLAFINGTKIPHTRSSKWGALKNVATKLNDVTCDCGEFPEAIRFIVVPDPKR